MYELFVTILQIFDLIRLDPLD